MEALSDRDRVSIRFAVPPVDVESVKLTNSDRFAVPPVDVESVKLIDSDRFAVPPVDVESVKLTDSVRFAVPPVDVESVKPMVSEIKTTFAAVVETLSDIDRVSGGSMT